MQIGLGLKGLQKGNQQNSGYVYDSYLDVTRIPLTRKYLKSLIGRLPDEFLGDSCKIA